MCNVRSNAQSYKMPTSKGLQLQYYKSIHVAYLSLTGLSTVRTRVLYVNAAIGTVQVCSLEINYGLCHLGI